MHAEAAYATGQVAHECHDGDTIVRQDELPIRFVDVGADLGKLRVGSDPRRDCYARPQVHLAPQLVHGILGG